MAGLSRSPDASLDSVATEVLRLLMSSSLLPLFLLPQLSCLALSRANISVRKRSLPRALVKEVSARASVLPSDQASEYVTSIMPATLLKICKSPPLKERDIQNSPSGPPTPHVYTCLGRLVSGSTEAESKPETPWKMRAGLLLFNINAQFALNSAAVNKKAVPEPKDGWIDKAYVKPVRELDALASYLKITVTSPGSLKNNI